MTTISEKEGNVFIEDIEDIGEGIPESEEQVEAEEAGAEAEAEESAEAADEETGAETESEDSEESAGESEAESNNESSEEDEELNVKYMRLMADFQNFRRRADRERSEIYARANENIMTGLIDVLDNFERALADDSAEGDEGFKKGMELIFNQLKDVLTKSGLEEIEAEGTDFDPNFHNAVMMEDTDKVESGKVSEVLQKGYMLNGRVIRASMVKVAN